MNDTIGKASQKTKIAAGLFWADYSVLGAQVLKPSQRGGSAASVAETTTSNIRELRTAIALFMRILRIPW